MLPEPPPCYTLWPLFHNCSAAEMFHLLLYQVLSIQQVFPSVSAIWINTHKHSVAWFLRIHRQFRHQPDTHGQHNENKMFHISNCIKHPQRTTKNSASFPEALFSLLCRLTILFLCGSFLCRRFSLLLCLSICCSCCRLATVLARYSRSGLRCIRYL